MIDSMKVYENQHRQIYASLHKLKTKSENAKTGDMAGLYILPLDEKPTDSIKNKTDAKQCGDCPLKRNLCYVNPVTVNGPYKTTHDQPVQEIPEEILKALRMGVYGDPALLPLSLLHELAYKAPRHTGYTHQWHRRRPEYSSLLMASIDNVSAQLHNNTAIQHKEWANSLGYRTFRVITPRQRTQKDEIQCPYTNGVQCADCGLCDGSHKGDKRKNIYIEIHGPQNKVKQYNKQSI